MKKAFSLIELTFSIVVIGLCLAAIPRVVEASLKSDEVGYRQEYFYELKELYGLIKNLPLSNKNICYDDYKNNSLLAQYCFDGSVSDYPNKVDLSLLNLNSRYKDNRNFDDNGSSNIESISSMSNLNNLSIKNAIGKQFRYNIQDSYSKIDKSSKITLEKMNKKTIKTNSNSFNELKTYQLLVKNDSIEKTGFYVFFTTTGRVESVFSQYLLKTQNTTWDSEIKEKLELFFNKGI